MNENVNNININTNTNVNNSNINTTPTVNNNITNCPNCSSNDIALDISAGKIKCNHCGQFIELKKYNKTVNNITELKQEIINKGASNIKYDDCNIVVLTCPRCNKMFFSGKNDGYQKCHWCGGDLNIGEEYEKIDGSSKILPFAVSKEEALSIIKEEMNNKKYISDISINRVNKESLKGVYLPYMTIKAKYKCIFKGQGERETDSHSNDDSTTYYLNLYDLSREFDIVANNIILDSKNETITNSDNVIKSIISVTNPFDYEDSVPLEGKYLKGYSAEVFNVQEIKIDDEFNNKLINIAKYAILKEISYYNNGVRWDITNIEIENVEYSYVYLPLWLYIYNSNNEYYYVALNGRTKEVAVHLEPNTSKAKKDAIIMAAICIFVIAVVFTPFICMGYFVADNHFRYDQQSSFIPLLIIPITIIIYFIGWFAIYRTQYKRNVGDSKDINNQKVDENDTLVDNDIIPINYTDTYVKNYTTGSGREIINCNDNGTEYRHKKMWDSLGARVIKRGK